MRAKDRLSPYPILSGFSDDYKSEFSFSSLINAEEDYGYLRIKVEFNLESQYLQELIDSNKAQFVTHIECPRTSYRKRLAGNVRVQSEYVPINSLTDLVEINTFIVAVADFEYSSNEFNQDYDGYIFQISRNEILAIGDSEKVSITNNTRDLESFPSVIRVVKIDEAEKAISVDTDGDIIKVKLSGKVFDVYKAIGNSIYSKTSFSLIVFPAILTALTRIASKEGDFNDCRWYQVLEKKLYEKKISPENLSLTDNSIIEACQQLFEDPIAKAFDELLKRNEVLNED